MMENEKAEIAKLVAKYGKVQSLMQYVNSKTLKESYLHQPKHKAVGVDEVVRPFLEPPQQAAGEVLRFPPLPDPLPLNYLLGWERTR